MNNIENHYRQFRRSADGFLDTFILGQRLLDCDTVQADDTAGVSKGVASFLNLEKVKVKVIDPNSNKFNASAVAYDFHVPPAKVFRAAVFPKSKLPQSEDPNTNDEDGVITITFDQVNCFL